MNTNQKRIVLSWMLALTMLCSMISLPQLNVYATESIMSDEGSSSSMSTDALGEVTTGSVINIKVLNASDLSIGDIAVDTQFQDYFTIAASSSKQVTIDAHEKAAVDGTTFTQRIKLNGSGSETERSIHFTTTDKATVEIYAISGSSSAERSLELYAKGGTIAIGTAEAKKIDIVKSIITLDNAGDYYLKSPSSGVNIYSIKVVTGDAPQEPDRPEWSSVKKPEITSVASKEGNDQVIQVNFTLDISQAGADRAIVEMQDETGTVIDSVVVGQSENATKRAEFTPSKSGNYRFVVKAERESEEPLISSVSDSFSYSLPLAAPVANVYNKGQGSILVKWPAVLEAEKYKVEYKAEGGEYIQAATVKGLEETIPSLMVGSTYTIRVTAIRGDDNVPSIEVLIKVKDEEEREWAFTYFGQSASGSLNTFEMVDSDNLQFKLNSCTVKSDGTIDKKGGKFTTFHDGISLYYTEVDAKTENFELTATFDLDYINLTPDGQEGFGLIAMDSIGEHGKSSPNHYTNSAAIIATKFEKKEAGVVTATSKDTIGTRFVSGITPEVLSGGDSAIAAAGKNVSAGYSYDPADLVKQGESYTLTLKKTNTGYHMILGNDLATERIMYHPDKLLQLDGEKVYVGFAAARGCNVTVRDISMKITNPATDAPAVPEPIEKVELITKIDSPAEASTSNYRFVWHANADGVITIQDSTGKVVADKEKVTANQDYTKALVLVKGKNDYTITFLPDVNYVTADGLQLNTYEAVTLKHSITYKSYSGTTLFVAPNGASSGTGTKASPIDIYTAVKYVAPGQIICLAGGTYNMTSKLIIPRGINGTENARITLKSAKGSRAILNFKDADGGMQLWGDYWHVYGIDVCETPGNIKGLQIAGHNNIIELVNTYRNGDTGLQISGTGTESYDQWPANNLILNCTSYDNCDPGENNADGFAAKITCGSGNVFKGCIAYNNLDDGWDLFAKIESGPIGAVIVENCIAFNNGTLTNGRGNGDGNGFKLGGDGISVPHVLRNSISFNNNTSGITSNSDPAIILENNTAYGNKGANISLYGKGSGDRNFIAVNNLSIAGGTADNYSEMPSLATENNYFFDGTRCVNSLGVQLDETIFVSTDRTIVPTRTAEGFINMNGLLELNDQAIAGIGAIIGSTKGPIDVGMEANETTSPGDSGNGGGSSSSSPSNSQTTNTAEKQLETALKEGKTPQVSVDKNNTVPLSQSIIKMLIESEKALVVAVNKNITLLVKTETLREQGDNSIVLKAGAPTKDVADKIALALKDMTNIAALNNSDLLFTLSLNTKKAAESFYEPIGITFDIVKRNIEDFSKLTAVRYETQKDGTIKVVKIGGEYDIKTGKFNVLTDQPGTFGLVVSEELVKLKLTIGDKEAVVNGLLAVNDVSSEIVNGRTMLPVRFITETLGGKVSWEKGTATITIDDKTMTFKVGETLEGYGVEPFTKDSRTFVPARWVAEEIGANVLWVPSSQKVEIVK
jgi:hypothetical protein